MSPLSVPNFKPDWSTHSRFMANFAKCAKRRKKWRKKTLTLAARISEMAGVIFFNFGMWTPLPSRHFCSNFSFNRIRNHGATKVWKSRLLSSCKYTYGVARRLLGPHDTLPCVLIPGFFDRIIVFKFIYWLPSIIWHTDLILPTADVQYMHYGLASVLLCVPVLFTEYASCQFMLYSVMRLNRGCVSLSLVFSIAIWLIVETLLMLIFVCNTV